MNPELYKAIAYGKDLARWDLTALLQVTIRGDNILHVAAKYDAKQVEQEIKKFPQLVQLVNQRNSKGDTPLHIAARMGSLKIAEILINSANNSTGREIESGERLTKMVNMKKDTALHDAVRNGYDQIANLLIREDPVLTLLTNDDGESPLFIAVDKQHLHIAKRILEAPDFSIQGRNKMNALHAAVVRSQNQVPRLDGYLERVLKNPMTVVANFSVMRWLKLLSFLPVIVKATATAASRSRSINELVKCLKGKRPSALSENDECGCTPLHYAVHLGAEDIFDLFVGSDSSTAYNRDRDLHIFDCNRDREGMSIVHIAAREGQVSLLEKLSNLAPEIWDLQDNKGQTALHLAVASEKLDCVKFILGASLSHNDLINQQDNEGNTALHLATIQGNRGKIFELLSNDSRVDKTAINMDGNTIVDILQLQEHVLLDKIWITMSAAKNGGLKSLGFLINKNSRKTRPTETRKVEQPQQSERRLDPAATASDTQVEGQQQRLAIVKRETEITGIKMHNYDQLQRIANVNFLVTTLIATVSFAAGFTIPGGYQSGGADEGMAILSRKSAFRVFVIANVVAFGLSTTSMFAHFFNSVAENPLSFAVNLDAIGSNIYITSFLTSYGITAMIIAFVSGTYAVLADCPGLATAVLLIGCSFFGVRFVFLK